MDQLQQAAKRERRAPIFWWLIVMAATGGALVVMVYDHSRLLAYFLGILLAAAWAAPLVAMQSLAAPPRAAVDALEMVHAADVDAWIVALYRHYRKLDACGAKG